ncbi:MAG: hypothetical protein GF346_12490 [Candidatus Eisenbacteria bacterium]|nr:hypothetical protein [Candidatus Latescibacterota bacterium]MBD3303255.1 hypothetical protein [Candidatus Eisenbacteria bacterium]
MSSSSSAAGSWVPLDLKSAGRGTPPADAADAGREAGTVEELVPLDLASRTDPAAPAMEGPDPQPGFEEGYAQARSERSREVGALLERLSAAAVELAEERKKLHEAFVRSVSGLAIGVAAKVIDREVAADPGVVRNLVEQALEGVPEDPAVSVRIHPDDLAALSDESGEPPERRPGGAVQWTEDPGLARGDFVVESPSRVVDGRIRTALKDLYDLLEYE